MPRLNARQHALIQALLSRGPLSEEEFRDLFAGVTGKNPASHQQMFNDYLLLINKELDYVQFELRGCRNQYDGKVYYGVVNNVADEQSKLGTKYSVPQIAFYKGVIEAIVQEVTNQGFITNIDALNIRLENQVQIGQSSPDSQSRIPPAFKNFSISQKEKTLNDLIQDRWLCRITDGKIGLGVRSFLDLRSWFRNNDVPPCDVCNEAGVKATTCPKEGCDTRMHDYCSKKRFSRQKVGRVCPRCGTAWPQEECDAEEEEEEEDEEDLSESHQMPSNNLLGRRTRSSTAEAEASQAQTESPSGSVPMKKPRRCKTEHIDATEVGPSQSTMPSPDPPRTRRSQRLRLHVSIS